MHKRQILKDKRPLNAVKFIRLFNFEIQTMISNSVNISTFDDWIYIVQCYTDSFIILQWKFNTFILYKWIHFIYTFFTYFFQYFWFFWPKMSLFVINFFFFLLKIHIPSFFFPDKLTAKTIVYSLYTYFVGKAAKQKRRSYKKYFFKIPK